MNNKHVIFPHLPERLSGLETLSMNLRWSWHPAARMLFKTLGRQAWKESVHNPVKVINAIRERARRRWVEGFNDVS